MNRKYQRQHQVLYDGKMNKTIKDDKSNYEHLKKGQNDLDSYKKDYKRRHDKKKGLARLDCYYENKIFDKIDYIYDLAKRMRNDKKTYKKYIYRKFTIHFTIFALLPLLGIIIPILFGGEKPQDRIVRLTYGSCRNKGSDGNCTKGFIHCTKDQIRAIGYLNFIFFLALAIIVLLSVIYIFVKIIKYERLKAGKGKMSGKEYINFCKNV
ncbi:hypothetical protein PVIIG_05560 [Plasmodium vivax India VII]|uniref:Variable surface protein Vir35 n=1 Tax=Plasmodium vivax India VII TaxID=1077284 RepID=A0A0J9SHB4_PLAVI|nr:hypothetical protein PVIIG_05560 [Plasmodium vivax India VII]